ncbi:MAG: MipA/OmpV family protein [Campylobacteraceae bacterium]|nr:MipA/OmpV family protein [Campylobacteraceae bacterium]
MKKILILLIFAMSLFGKETSSLTYGLGLGFISVPSYIGSKERKNLFLPFPYIEYRSDKININRDEIYSDYFKTQKSKVQLSLRGMLPVKSKDSKREGMDDLDATLEVGPNFIYHLKQNKMSSLDLEFPVRAVFSVGSSGIRYQGYLANVNLHYKEEFSNNIKLTLKTGLVWGDSDYHNYFYEIKKNDVTSNRSEYHASSGYGGWQNSIGLSKKDDKFWYGMFVKYYNLDKVSYSKSPLVETKSALFYGLAFSYLF